MRLVDTSAWIEFLTGSVFGVQLAAELSARCKLATADAIITATAQANRAELLTCDRHFEGLPGVLLFAKPGQ